MTWCGQLLVVLACASLVAASGCAPRTLVRAREGSIHDGSGVGDHLDNLECLWWIGSDDPDDRVSVHFSSFETECVWDVLFVHDGESVEDLLLGAFSGGILPDDFVSSSNRILVHFSSDANLHYDGFMLHYSIGHCGFNCSGVGTCIDGRCVCPAAQAGRYCEREFCPRDCQGHGKCSVDGQCACEEGFWGESCGELTGVPDAWDEIMTNESTVPPADVQRMAHASAVDIDGRALYVVGGESFAKGHLDDMLKLDLSTRLWTVVPADSVPPTAHHCFVRVGRLMYLFGGTSEGHGARDDFFVFDPDTETWTPGPPEGAPSARYGHAASSNLDATALYLHGGYSREEGFMGDFFRFDVAEGTWESMEVTGTEPYPVALHSMVSVPYQGHGVLLVYGGTSRRVTYGNELHMFHEDTRQWTFIETTGPRKGRFSHAAVSQGHLMFVYGGRVTGDNECFLSEVWTYDLTCNVWEPVLEKPNSTTVPGRYLAPVAAAGSSPDTLLLFGGFSTAQRGDVWRFTPYPCTSPEGCPYGKESTCGSLCSSLTSCATCALDSNCGWCHLNNQCIAGGESAPPSCSVMGMWDYEGVCTVSSCLYSNCDDCTADSGCGWCFSDETCLSAQGTCQHYFVDSCPPPCESEYDCRTCASRPECRHCQLQPRGCTKRNGPCNYNPTDEPDRCPAPCESLSTCAECATRLPTECMWCETIGQCIFSVDYAFTSEIGDCFDWAYGPTACGRPCSVHTSCDSCTEQLDCGWCSATNTCMEGGISSSTNSSGVVCSASDWEYQECACEADVCSDCLADPKCGWCASSFTCHRGNATHVHSGTCPVWDYGQCYNCSNHATCDACVSDEQCGYCHKTMECMRGNEVGTLGCPSEPLAAGWDFMECRSCEKHTSCFDCVEDRYCGYCATSGTCQRGDTNDQFAATCPSWDYAHCNHYCEAAHRTCGGCVSDPNCGWCCESNTCQAGGCMSFHEDECPTCSDKTSCSQCAADMCCGWCQTSLSCTFGNESGPLPPLDDTKLEPCDGGLSAYHAAGRCPFECEVFTDCQSCAIVAACGWCYNEVMEEGTCMAGQVSGQRPLECGANYHYSTCISFLEEIPYTPRMPSEGLSPFSLIVIYGVAFFSGSLLGIVTLIIVIKKIEEYIGRRQEQLDPHRRREGVELQNLVPFIVVHVPALEGEEGEEGEEAGAHGDSFFVSRVPGSNDPKIFVAIRMPSDALTLEDHAGLPLIMLGSATAPDEELEVLNMAPSRPPPPLPPRSHSLRERTAIAVTEPSLDDGEAIPADVAVMDDQDDTWIELDDVGDTPLGEASSIPPHVTGSVEMHSSSSHTDPTRPLFAGSSHSSER